MRVSSRFAAALSVTIVAAAFSWPAWTHGTDPWVAPDEAKAMKNPYPATPENLAFAARVYEKKCLPCHGEAGNGKGKVAMQMGLHPADFTDAGMMSEMSDGELFYKITTGRDPMPSFADKIPDDKTRWLLVHYLRTFSAGRDSNAGDQSRAEEEDGS